MADEILLNEAAYAVWQAVYAAGANGVNLDELANKFHVDQSQVAATSVEAQKCGYFKIDEQDCEELIPCEGARELIDNRALPEERAVCYLLDTSVLLSLPEFIEWAKVSNVPVNEVFKWGVLREWIERIKNPNGAFVKLTDKGSTAAKSNFAGEDDLEALHLA